MVTHYDDNLLLDTDSYKLTHWLQYPPHTQRVSAYVESRGGDYDEILFFGLQAFLRNVLQRPVQSADIDEAEALTRAHLGRDDCFNREGWNHILQRHDGRLPVRIQALPEGCVVGHRIPVLQIVNTDPACFWLPTYLETALLRAVWYPSTVASVSLACKRVLHRYLSETADTTDSLALALHDFGARGASSEATAALGGAAHLLNFHGTDTLSGLRLARRCYDEPMAGFSIPAAEHSTMTTWGREAEADAFGNMLRRFGGRDHVVAIVVDSYDLWNAIDRVVGELLKADLEARGGRVVIRPDSGEPTEVLPAVIEHLMQRFGHRINDKGYRLLPDFLRVIQGDGVTPASLPRILEAVRQRGLSTENCNFGMGGGLLQKLDRDTLKWAMKASWAQVEGEPRDVWKHPVTDPGKASRRGRWAVIGGPGRYAAVPEAELGSRPNLLQPVFENGRLLRQHDFAEIRRRAAQHFDSTAPQGRSSQPHPIPL